MTVKDSTQYACGDGWRNLIDTAIDQIKFTDYRIVIDRVNEDRGGLKIQYHPHNVHADSIIKLVERIASETCENCGEHPARRQLIRGWWKTFCAKCVSIEKKN